MNPYLSLAALIAAGLAGVEAGLELEDAYEGNAYVGDKPRVPATMHAARDLFAESTLAREAFGMPWSSTTSTTPGSSSSSSMQP